MFYAGWRKGSRSRVVAPLVEEGNRHPHAPEFARRLFAAQRLGARRRYARSPVGRRAGTFRLVQTARPAGIGTEALPGRPPRSGAISDHGTGGRRPARDPQTDA